MMPPATNPQTMMLPDDIAQRVRATLARMQDESWTARVWREDARLWRSEPEHVAEISSRLGWLQLPARVAPELSKLTSVAEDARGEFDRVVLLGMGGSSLAPRCLAEIVGAAEGYPELAVLDSTVPADVLAATGDAPIHRCLFIVSSKSGTTTETRSAFEFFWQEVVTAVGEQAAGAHFIAITDPDTPLAALARERGARAIFANWADIGGRYSALSYFGLVPAALIGLPAERMVARASEMAGGCAAEVPVEQNPGAVLGALLGVCHEMGRDKVTFLTSQRLASFGDWAEQLLAESTGKEGKGLVPVVGESPPASDVYGPDRLFVYIRQPGDDTHDALIAALATAGHPVVQIDVRDPESISAEMFRWEFATAIAGVAMGIDPFDQPDVQSAKDRTKQVLAEYSKIGRLPEQRADVVEGALGVFGTTSGHVRGAIAGLIDSIEVGDYFAIMAYLPRGEAVEDAVARMRAAVAEARGVATTFGYGPRFLHSTGQLHKGGPNTGVFLQITARYTEELPIPGADYDFATLVAAQAAGDFAALQASGRRALSVDLGDDWPENLGRLMEMIAEDTWR